jgi:hypothetical protein
MTQIDNEALLRSLHSMPIELAPEGLKAALDAYEDAVEEFQEANRLAQNAPDEVEEANVQFEVDLRAAVQANKPSPSKDQIERAEVRVRIAVEAVTAKAEAAKAAKFAVLAHTRNQEFREQWRTNCETEAGKLRGQLTELFDKVAPVIGLYKSILGCTHWLGDYPDNPNFGVFYGSIEYFRETLSLQPWAAPSTTPLAPRTIKGVHGMRYYDPQTGQEIMSTTS